MGNELARVDSGDKRDCPSLKSHLLPGLGSWIRSGAAPGDLQTGKCPAVSFQFGRLETPSGFPVLEGQSGEVNSENSVPGFLSWP